MLDDYVQGIFRLKARAAKQSRDYELLSILQIRLKENIGDAQMYGPTKDNAADRMIILHELNKIAERLVESSFDDFCAMPKSQNMPDSTDVAAKHEVQEMSSIEKKALQEALLSAFPTPGSLQQMVAFQLGQNLTVIAGGNNYGEIVFNLIMWAESQGETEKMLIGSQQMNPGNVRLNSLIENYQSIRRHHP